MEKMTSEEFRKRFAPHADSPKKKATRIEWEHALQVEFFIKLRPLINEFPELVWCHSIPNELGKSYDAQSAARNKRLIDEGLTAGVFDIFVPCARGKWHGLYLETKRPKTTHPETGKPVAAGTLSAEQRAFKEHCDREHYLCATYYNADEGITIVRKYMQGLL